MFYGENSFDDILSLLKKIWYRVGIQKTSYANS